MQGSHLWMITMTLLKLNTSPRNQRPHRRSFNPPPRTQQREQQPSWKKIFHRTLLSISRKSLQVGLLNPEPFFVPTASFFSDETSTAVAISIVQQLCFQHKECVGSFESKTKGEEEAHDNQVWFQLAGLWLIKFHRCCLLKWRCFSGFLVLHNLFALHSNRSNVDVFLRSLVPGWLKIN